MPKLKRNVVLCLLSVPCLTVAWSQYNEKAIATAQLSAQSCESDPPRLQERVREQLLRREEVPSAKIEPGAVPATCARTLDAG